MKATLETTMKPDEEVGVIGQPDSNLPNLKDRPPSWILPVIVTSQFLGTALWFAPNAVFSQLITALNLEESDFSLVSSLTQIGFIVGTFVFALFGVADRLKPSNVFLVSAIIGAVSNLAVIWSKGLAGILFLRFVTGFFLAGIYPVGMKIAADWYRPLGPALGVLVGALCFGSALPYILNKIPQSWQALLIETSAGAAAAGLVMGWVVPEGPHRQPATRFEPQLIVHLFRNKDFAAAAFGYFGHLWEIYGFWAYLPVVWKHYFESTQSSESQLDVIVFAIIAIGALGCVVGGRLSIRYGSARIATLSLMVSGLFCTVSPVLYILPFPLTVTLYLLWGIAVAADSPQFSSLVAQAVCPKHRGTALTLSTSIGFALTIAIVQILGAVSFSTQYLFLLLVPGPVLGVLSMISLVRKEIESFSAKAGRKDENAAESIVAGETGTSGNSSVHQIESDEEADVQSTEHPSA